MKFMKSFDECSEALSGARAGKTFHHSSYNFSFYFEMSE